MSLYESSMLNWRDNEDKGNINIRHIRCTKKTLQLKPDKGYLLSGMKTHSRSSPVESKVLNYSTGQASNYWSKSSYFGISGTYLTQ